MSSFSSTLIEDLISKFSQFSDNNQSNDENTQKQIIEINSTISELFGKVLLSENIAIIKSKAKKEFRPALKDYLSSLINLMESSNESNLEIYISHVREISCLFMIFSKLSLQLLRLVAKLWATVNSEKVRVKAFLIAHRLVRLGDENFVKKSIKKFTSLYLQNTKFVNEHYLPLINFMMRSLCELFAINLPLAYQYTFIHVRQTAIRLGNAIVSHQTDSVKCWSYVCSLRLWTAVVCSQCSNSEMRLLIHPLVQVITATIKLFNNAKFLPLRFHLIDLLNQLSSASGLYVPSLGLVIEVFNLVDFNKRSNNSSPDMSFILHFSDANIRDRTFVDSVFGSIESGIIESVQMHSQSMAFPELVVPLSVKLRKFLKSCKFRGYSVRVKSIITQIENNSTFIKSRRTNKPKMDDKNILEQDTPFSEFYRNWKSGRKCDLTKPNLSGKKRPIKRSKRIKKTESVLSDS